MKKYKAVFTRKSITKSVVSQYISLYRTMAEIRLAEEQIADLVSKHEIICPCHLYIGQEAVATGVCAALRKDDWVFSTHRSHGHYLAKGGDIKSMMAELFGRDVGCSGGRGGSMHLADTAVGLPGSSAIVAGTIPLAVGAALAFKSQNNNAVAVAFFGDGAVCEGSFYESLNIASLMKLPVIFVCENNLYSTHLPIARCLADTAIYKKASIFDMPGTAIDGNDVLMVCKTAAKAVKRARNGEGPTLIECLTYRWLGHVGPSNDIDKGLRSKSELASWKKKCPINRLKTIMVDQDLASEDELKQVQRVLEKKIRMAVSRAKGSRYPAGVTLLKHVFKDK